MAAVAIRGTTYPIVLPKLRDPRLHLAATIVSLQVLGQVAFDFKLSISQILISLVTCAVIELAITIHRQKALIWPASALLTGNGVAFVLRVPGTQHGDWWSFHGWWIYVATSAGSLLSKYVIKWRGEHIFNPSNIGLVAVFLILGRTKVEPLDFWWGPMSWWMALALIIIVTGGFTILWRLKLLRVALSFWAAFAIGIGALALAGHQMTARWHLGPIEGFSFWWVLVTSPEVLVFLFFMITDPKTAPRGPRARVVYAVVLGALASALIAPTRTEFAAKVALLSSLAIVCLAKALLEIAPIRVTRTRIAVATAVGIAAWAGVVLLGSSTSPSLAAQQVAAGQLPQIRILHSPGVQTQLDEPTAKLIAEAVVAAEPAAANQTLAVHLVPGTDQSPPTAVAQLGSSTYHLNIQADGSWSLAGAAPSTPTTPVSEPSSSKLTGTKLTDVAASVGLDFRQGSFRYGISNDYRAMMGGGVCFLDYNGDGWEDLFVVNSYASADADRWQAHGGLPTTELFRNDHGRFVNVTAASHAGLPVQGNGCVAADLNGDGHPDLIVTTTSGIDLLWNNGNGTFSEGAQAAGMTATGWYSGIAVADVNGDGRPDVFVAGYSDPNDPVENSLAGFPTNLTGVRDLLYLNEGNGRFREVGVQAGLESSDFSHGLGAQFFDYNDDGRPDLYVANDEDPNELYENVPYPGGAAADPAGLGFRFEQRSLAEGVADPYAGMGIASASRPNGLLDLFVTNSRGERSAAYAERPGPGSPAFASARSLYDPALGTSFAGWGDSWVDVANSGTPDLVLAAGAIPVTNLSKDAEEIRVLAPTRDGGYGNANGILVPKGLSRNGRGVAAADVDNNGRMDVAINSIGGKLVLLQPSGPSGHWLDVQTATFAPGAVVTVTLPGGRRLVRQTQAGSSFLSSEDPRLHFGLGAATRVTSVSVRYPWNGGTRTIGPVAADRIVTVPGPAAQPARTTASAAAYVLPGCTPESGRGSIATAWERTALDVLQEGGASEPVQARNLYDLADAMRSAYTQTATAAAQKAAISYAAFRLLAWRAAYDDNLDSTFALLVEELRGLCYSPDYTSTSGSSPAAIGNRIAEAAIQAGRNDGSHEPIRYADPSYIPQNGPLVLSQPGSTVHDATFWQPIALGVKPVPGGGSVPAAVQTFVGAQWGGVRTFAGRVNAPAPPFGDPAGKAYTGAAIAVIRATAEPGAPRVDTSPVAWNRIAIAHAPADLAQDLRLYRTLNGALNDAAVSAWGAKRQYEAPRPVSMIRYLAFNNELPLVSGLVEKKDGQVLVRSQGRWVAGDAWRPPAATPASPGWVSEGAAFGYAANAVLTSLTGRSFAATAARLAHAGLAEGIETPQDEAAGRTLGTKVGQLALDKTG